MTGNHSPLLTQPSAPPARASADDEALAVYAKALAHPVRVQIVRMLARRESRQCCDIVGELPLAQSTVSEHLRVLRAAGIVRGRECGARVAYCLVPDALTRLKALFAGL